MNPRRNRSFARTRWYRDLKAALADSGGNCRLCGARYGHASVDPDGLRLAHLAPISATAAPTSRTACTLACRLCDHVMRNDDWTGKAPSLAEQPDVTWRPEKPVISHNHRARRRLAGKTWEWAGDNWRIVKRRGGAS